MEIFGKIMLVLVLLAGLFYVAIIGAARFDKSQTKKSCEVFAVESGRKTKYVDYTNFQQDCLTLTDKGWISAFNLRGN